MLTIQRAAPDDFAAVSALDPYFPERELRARLSAGSEKILLLREDGAAAGLLCWTLFWDYIPYAYYLNIAEPFRGRGYAKQALQFWEDALRREGRPTAMASIPSDDAAQSFYRAMGYRDAGCLLMKEGPFAQPPELFFVKQLGPPAPDCLGGIFKSK